jgi:hypothetical protein
MAERRIAPSGFGGRPGLSILAGQARGTLQREAIDRENERQAILNRMTESQMESMAQSRRLAQEEADWQRGERERAEQNRLAAAENIKAFLTEVGGPNVSEDASLEAIQATLDASRSWYQEQAARARTTASNLSAEQSTLAIRASKLAEAAQVLMGREDFFKMAFFEEVPSQTDDHAARRQHMREHGTPLIELKERPTGGISELTRRRAIEEWATAMGVDKQAANIAYDALRAQAQKLQSSDNPWTGGENKLDPQTVREYADEAIDLFGGDMDAAIGRMEANAVGKDAAEARQIQQVIDEIKKRKGGGFDVKVQ